MKQEEIDEVLSNNPYPKEKQGHIDWENGAISMLQAIQSSHAEGRTDEESIFWKNLSERYRKQTGSK